MLVRELMKDIAPERIPARYNRPVRGLAYDAASVLPGMAYFALRQSACDGHDHVAEAVDRGAGLIVMEQFGQVSPRVVAVRVRDSRVALARAAALFHGWPSRELRVVAVTGGAHLPGVAYFLRQFLSLAGDPAGLIGTLEHHLGRHVLPSRAGCEEPLDIQRMLASMLREDLRTGVVELDACACEHGWARDLEIHTLVQLPAPSGAGAPPALRARRRFSVDLDTGSDFTVGVRDGGGRPLFQLPVASRRATPEGWVCQVDLPDGRRALRLPFLGGDQLEAALSAAVAAVALGVPSDRLPALCRRLQGIPGEREIIRQGQPFTLLVDGAAEPDTLAELVREVRGLTAGRLLLLAGARGDQTSPVRSQLGFVAGRAANFTLFTGNDPGGECPVRLNTPALEAAVTTRPGGADLEPDRGCAIDRLVRLALPGDLVLLTGKGRRTTQEIDHSIVPFDDRLHAARTLDALGWRRDRRRKPLATR
ncbi:MAG: hypothetical protein H7A46_11590 [Verrucomicrobiales bacterium]|nr:hypothetical protein [Verrucomicrobiales bacterium]